jgi:hypothetical protein
MPSLAKFQTQQICTNKKEPTFSETVQLPGSIERGNEMSKFLKISGVALLAASISGAAFAQAGGGNPNAAGPNSSGTGLVQPGTTSTGVATDAKPVKGQTGTTGMNDKAGMGAKDGMKNSSKTPDNK